jgi:two-component system, chemotaxis family, CheB/CheR fusion protein
MSDAPPASTVESKPFFVVGVGASAGGLEALGALVRHVTLETMAFIVVQHLAPTHDSALPTLLSRSTPIEVLLAADGQTVEPNRVYVIPPNADLLIEGGVLRVISPQSTSGPRLPIDSFFRSLAADQGSRAVGVILSGNGSDGTLGLKAIKEACGLAFAQDVASAKYGGMPRAALASGCIDFSGTPEALARELMELGTHSYPSAAPEPELQTECLGRLLRILHASGTDFREYKTSTIQRRIERRMLLHKIERIEDYLKLVQSDAAELRALRKDLLIGVTNFFRDHDPFEALRTKVFPHILAAKKEQTSIRVWVPACSTGEEAYSIAIALLEYLDENGHDVRVQIFATDVDDEAIQIARRGIFPDNIALDVSAERLQRFFVKREDGYQVSRRVRDLVVFSVHTVGKDSPFSHLDLVTCRNLLIYLQPSLQASVLRHLHYSLNPGGFLLLGSSETVGDSPELFSLLDRKNKLYARKSVASSLRALELGTTAPPDPPTARPLRTGGSLRPIVTIAALAERKVLDLYGPPGVVINENLEVLHFRGRISPFLEPAAGAASLSLMRLARPELHVDLRRAIHDAQASGARVSIASKLTDADLVHAFQLDVIPLVDPQTQSKCLLLLFHEPHASELALPTAAPGESPSQTEHRILDLERELVLTKEYLQETIEELEGANEELQSSNEELQSSNEEMQSTNEELETSKEEMQSTNEELTTVNEELQNRMVELQQVNDDLHNVLTGVDNAVVIAGLNQRIRRFTNAAARLFDLGPADIGRPIAHLSSFVSNLRLDHLAASVIDTLIPVEQEIRGSDGRWYHLRIAPYKTLEHSIQGTVIVLSDIDVRKRSLVLGSDVAAYALRFLASIDGPLLIVDDGARVLWANERFYVDFQVTEEETVGNLLTRIGDGHWSSPDLANAIVGTAATGTPFRDLRVLYQRAGAGERAVKVSGSRLPPLGEQSSLVLLNLDKA